MTRGIEQQLHAFRSEAPFPDPATADAVLRRVGERSSGRRSRQRRVVPALALATLALTGGALAAVRELPWWQDGAPPVDPQSVVMVARDNLPAKVAVADARTVATDGDAALVAVPVNRTGYCLIPSFAGRAAFGADCVYRSDGDDVVRSAGRASDAGVWLVYGRIADRRAASIDLGALSAKLENGGFFVVRVPEDRWPALRGHTNAGRVVDASGAPLRRGCVQWGSGPRDGADASPVLWRGGGGACRVQAPPRPPTVDMAAAKRILDVTLRESYSIWQPGESVGFYAAPASDGSTCVAAAGPGLPPDESMRGPGCRGTTLPSARTRPLAASMGAQLTHVGDRAVYVWSASGSFDPHRVARVELRTADGVVEAASAEGFFFVQFGQQTPGPSSAPRLPPGRHVLVGRDAAGAEVARLDLNELYEKATPH